MKRWGKFFKKQKGLRVLSGLLLAASVGISGIPSEAGTRIKGDDGTGPVLVLGADLSEAQKEEVLDLLGIDSRMLAQCKVLTVTGEQVREYLEGAYPEEAVEETALSSILIRPVHEDVGLQVSVQNIGWCTAEMYQRLLSEAGLLSIEDERLDVEVSVAAPSGGSQGTAALVGALFACEEIRDQDIHETTEERALSLALEAKEEALDAGSEDSQADAMDLMKIEGIGSPESGEVNLATGQLYLEQLDFPGGEESPMEFTRYYLSPDHVQDREGNYTGLGNYWAHSYFYYADIFRMNVIIYFPDGSTQNWYQEYRRGWQTSDEIAYTLEETGEDFLLTGPEGEKVLIGSDGWAKEITRPDGSVVELSYEDGKLSRVTEGENWLEFEFAGDYISSVTDSAGNTVSYEQDSLGNLVSTQGEESSWLYAYDEHRNRYTGSNLTLMTDGAGTPLLEAKFAAGIEVGDACQVRSMKAAGQPAFSFSYRPYDGINICTEENGNSLVLMYEWLVEDVYTWTWYDAQGNVMRRETTTD